MDLKFKKKSSYDTTPGTITFNTSTKRVGVANSDSTVTEYGGGTTYLDELKIRTSDINYSQGSLKVGDQLYASDLNVNRFALMPADYISIECSTDGGNLWTEYPNLLASDPYILFSKKDSKSFYLGGVSTNDNPTDCQLRITIDIPTDTYKFYGTINKFYIWASTNGTSKFTVDVTVYKKTNENTPTVICKNHPLGGWSGHNTINLHNTIGGSETYGSGNKLEFLFKQTAGTGNYTNKNACIYSIFAYCDNIWTTPSNLAKTGHMYNWYGLETVFPSTVYAYDKYNVDNKLMTASDVDSKIEDSWTWGEYD